MKGAQMRECRKGMKLGQIEFGRLMGYTGNAKTVKDTVYKYESGKRDIPPMVARLAWLLSELYKAGIAPEFPNWPLYQTEQSNEIGIVAAAMILATSTAMAQQSQRVPDQYVFTVSPQDADKIGAALALRPLGEVRDLYQKLQNQAQEQNARANLSAPQAEPAK